MPAIRPGPGYRSWGYQLFLNNQFRKSMEKKMKLDINTTYALVAAKFPPTPYEEINIGSLKLALNGREFIYDAETTELSWEDGCEVEDGEQLYTSLESSCWVDEYVFPECPYNLTEEDLSNPNLVATFFVEGFEEVEGASVEAVVYVGENEYHLTNVKFE